MALQPWRKGIVTHIKELNSLTRSFLIKVPELSEFDFAPGQFVTFDLPIDEKINKRLRSYSIASSPDHSNVFEICVETNHIGIGASYIFNEVHEGSELIFRGPSGVFTFQNNLVDTNFFICESTGIVPFVSMIRNMVGKQNAHKNLYLIYGGKRKDELLYHDEITALEKIIPQFQYIPVLSAENWEGKCGTVHQVYEPLVTSFMSRSANEISTAKFYICGWKEMVDETKRILLENRIDKKDIIQELYG